MSDLGNSRRSTDRPGTHPFRLSRRHRAITGVTTLALVLVVGLIWSTPQGQRVWHGSSASEVELQRQTARADDLATQLAAAEAKLKAPRPTPDDVVQKARADDLKGQVEALQTKLDQALRANGEVVAQTARADDLAGRIKEMTAALSKARPAPADKAGQARAADLKRQVEDLSYRIQHPQAYVPPAVVATRTRSEIIAASKLFGLYTAQSPFNYGEFDQVQADVARTADISGYFQSWETDFRPDAVQAAWSRGQIPLLTWESQAQVGAISSTAPEYSLPTIINGQHDAYLHQYARDIAATGLPLVLRFDHEMNGTWYPWSEIRGWDKGRVNGNSPGDFAKMWRHVHDIFQAEGANDYVVWLWSPNRVNKIPSQPAPAAFYPGDGYVDWIGMSGYYRPGDPRPAFDDTYGKTLPLLRATARKPIFLSEIGATENTGHKAEWITDLFAALQQPGNADIIGIGWFNLSVTATGEAGTTTNDWRINSTGSATRAMARGLAAAGWGSAPEPTP